MDDYAPTQAADGTDRASLSVGVWERDLERGDSLGRYLILGVVGRGGMGVVYAAYDPELDRKVAIKLLDRRPGLTARAGLVREAKAMARLSHTNVVSVFDVAEAETSVFIAMEFIEGKTLGAWFEDSPRSVGDIIRTFTEAGRGLAAAHAAGIVHRDFKPANVMVTGDGRVVVVDFGIADVRGGSAAGDDDPPPGTPGYMSPEQLAGASSDERSDQFSFCVALYRALYGASPFPGDSVGAVVAAVLEGEIAVPPRRSSVPRRIRGVLLRGLARNASDRFPSMDALLVALHAANRSRVRGLLAGAVVVFAGLGGLVGLRDQPVADPCESAAAPIREVWSEDRRAQVQTTLSASSQHASTWPRVAADLDAYVEAWAQEQRDTCRASLSVAAASAVPTARRIQCLDGMLMSFDAVTGVLSRPDLPTPTEVINLATGLVQPAQCRESSVARLLPPLPGDPSLREAVVGARRRLAKAQVEVSMGRVAAGAAQGEALLSEAETIGYGPLVLEVEALLARCAAYFGDRTKLPVAQRVIMEARRKGREDILIDGLYAAARLNVRYDEDSRLALFQINVARATAQRIGWVLSEANLDLLYASIVRRRNEGDDLEVAADAARRALTVLTEHGTPGEVIDALNQVGTTALKQGHISPATRYLERALQLADEHYGPDYLVRGLVTLQLARLREHQCEYDAARILIEQSLETYDKSYERAAVPTMAALGSLCVVEEQLGQFDRARSTARRAYELGVEHYERPSGDLSILRNVHAHLLFKTGEYEVAERLFRESAEDSERLQGPASLQTLFDRDRVADCLRATGRSSEALAEYEAVAAIRRETGGPVAAELPRTLAGMALVHDMRGESDAALAHARQAVAELRDTDPDNERFRIARFVLAYVLRRAGHDDEANEYAQEVAGVLERMNDQSIFAATFRRWLDGEDVAPVY